MSDKELAEICGKAVQKFLSEQTLKNAVETFPQIIEKAKKNFERVCAEEITNLIKIKFNGWPGMLVGAEFEVKEAPKTPPGIVVRVTKTKFIKGIELGYAHLQKGYRNIVFTPEGLFSCRSAVISREMFSDGKGRLVPQWYVEEDNPHKHRDPKKISFYELLGENPSLKKLAIVLENIT